MCIFAINTNPNIQIINIKINEFIEPSFFSIKCVCLAITAASKLKTAIKIPQYIIGISIISMYGLKVCRDILPASAITMLENIRNATMRDENIHFIADVVCENGLGAFFKFSLGGSVKNNMSIILIN